MTTKPDFDKGLLSKFDRRMTATQDAHRGLTEVGITDTCGAQRSLEQALLRSHPDLQKACDEFRRAGREARHAIQDAEGKQSYRLQRETILKLIGSRVGRCSCDGGVRNFQLPFVNGAADASFGTSSPVTTVQQGVAGWGNFLATPPRIVNTGSGNGHTINGNLDLYWRTTVPHSGNFTMQPNQICSSFVVYGHHKVTADGWFLSSNDAVAEVHAWVIVYLGGQWLDSRYMLVSSDATRSENRTRSFGARVDLPGRITFQAEAGQELGMIVRLYGFTWANDQGLAEINIDLFGVPANTLADLTIDVLD